MAAYKRRSKARWQQLIEAQQSRGLSHKAFRQREGLSIGSFSNWKCKLKDRESFLIVEIGVKTCFDPDSQNTRVWLDCR